MAITNPGFEDAGAGQGAADGWTSTSSGGAQGYGAIAAGDGLTYAWEGFDGWVADQAEYRDALGSGDVAAGAVESFELWSSTQVDYRAEGFSDGDVTAGTTETLENWSAGQGDYRPNGFHPGGLTAGTAETFEAWIASQSDYRDTGFDPGDTTVGAIQAGFSTSGSAEAFEPNRADVACAATASSATISAPGHAFIVNDPVRFEVEGNGALFAPFAKNTTYWVASIVAGVSVTVAPAAFGSAITATQSGEATLVGAEASFWRNPVSAW